MHILFLTHYFPPEVNAPASRTYEHAKRWLDQPDVRVTVVTNHPNHPKGVLYPGYRNQWITVEVIDGIAVRRVKTYLAANAAVVRRTLNYVVFMVAATVASFKVSKPDVVVATSPQFFCAIAGYIVSRIKRRPFIFELRDIWPDSIVTVGALKAGWGIRLLEKLELFLYRKAALIVAVTDAFKENLTSRGISGAKITVVKNGVDLEFFQPRAKPEALAAELRAEGKFVAAYIGTIGMAHAVENIVEAAELLRDNPNILFLVVGEGARKASVESLVAEKQLENVKVLPGVNKQRIRDYYALADVNLVTLRDQPLFRAVIPSKIFEIMAMARPIISSVEGESRDILTLSGAAEFVRPESASEMAAAIVALSGDEQRLRKMATCGREFVERFYRRERSAAEFLDRLRAVAAAQ